MFDQMGDPVTGIGKREPFEQGGEFREPLFGSLFELIVTHGRVMVPAIDTNSSLLAIEWGQRNNPCDAERFGSPSGHRRPVRCCSDDEKDIHEGA